MVISIDADNTHDKIQHSLMISKMLSKLGREGDFLWYYKEKNTLQLTLHSIGERPNFLILKPGIKAKMSAFTTPNQHCTRVLGSTIKEENKSKAYRLERKK